MRRLVHSNHQLPFFRNLSVAVTSPAIQRSYPGFPNLTPGEFARFFADTYGRFKRLSFGERVAYLVTEPLPSGELKISQYTEWLERMFRDAYFAKLENPTDYTLQKVYVPFVTGLNNLTAWRDASGNTIINGYYTDKNIRTLMTGRPLCEVTSGTKRYVYYALHSDRECAQTSLVLFNQAKMTAMMHSLAPLFVLHKSIEMVNSDLLTRAAMIKRDPDQKSVMGGRTARDAWIALLDSLSEEMSPEFKKMVASTIAIKHPATLRAMERRQELISLDDERTTRSSLHLLLEWLHLVGFQLSPMHIEPQQEDNLAAARAVHNTWMILVESMAKMFAKTAPASKNRVTGKFFKIPGTDVISNGELEVQAELDGQVFKISQQFDALVRDPEQLRVTDVPGLSATIVALFNHKRPTSVTTVRVMPTEPMRLL